MALDPLRYAALKAAILADATMAAMFAAGEIGRIVDYANTPSGTTKIWRPNISVAELANVIVWSDFAALLIGPQNAYLAMTAGGYVDATSPTIQAGFAAVFGVASTSTTALKALAQRTATPFEKLFTTNGVSAVFGQLLTTDDVVAAMK